MTFRVRTLDPNIRTRTLAPKMWIASILGLHLHISSDRHDATFYVTFHATSATIHVFQNDVTLSTWCHEHFQNVLTSSTQRHARLRHDNLLWYVQNIISAESTAHKHGNIYCMNTFTNTWTFQICWTLKYLYYMYTIFLIHFTDIQISILPSLPVYRALTICKYCICVESSKDF